MSGLESAGDSFRVGDLESIDGLEFLEDPDTTLAVVHLERLEEEVDELEEGLLDVDAEVGEGAEPADGTPGGEAAEE